MWYKRKASLTSSTVGNLGKLVPSLNENVIMPVAVPQLSQTPLDELILPPVLVP